MKNCSLCLPPHSAVAAECTAMCHATAGWPAYWGQCSPEGGRCLGGPHSPPPHPPQTNPLLLASTAACTAATPTISSPRSLAALLLQSARSAPPCLQYDGYPDECITEGVCQYVDVGQGPVSYEPTTGGKGRSEWLRPAAG